MDPKPTVGISDYSAFYNNPVLNTDPLGNSPFSTHTDKNGNVLKVYDDNDKGVYKHDNAKSPQDIEKSYNSRNTSAGGVKMGETLTSLGFADFDMYQKNRTIQAATGAKIDFNSTWATDKVNEILKADPNPLTYALKARSGHDWDIKTKIPEGQNLYFGSKLFGKYVSARDAGNFAAGAVAQKSIFSNDLFDYGYGIYNLSGNNIGKSILMIASDIEKLSVLPIKGVPNISYKILFGEDKLSRVGIEAGKSYIKNLK